MLANALRRRRLESAHRDQLAGLERSVARLRTMTMVVNDIEADPAAVDGHDMIERLSRAVSFRDEETAHHIERVSRYSALVARVLGYPGASIEQVRQATALHDVGKIGIPDVILLKPGPLSQEERLAMQRHAPIGGQLLAGSSELLTAAATVAVGHHEWWDGSGYPHGLSGEQIPVLARIAAVADVFDSLTSDRIYRPAIPVEDAIGLMHDLRRRQFDPRILDAFLGALVEAAAIREAYPDRDEEDSRIRVLVVDDHEIFLQSLVRLLSAQPSVKVIGTARTAAESLTAAAAYQPDVVLMDLELPDGDGIAATQRIRVLAPRTKVVMLTGHADRDVFARAVEAGCAGFVNKAEPAEALLETIRAVHDGESLTSGTTLSELLGRLATTGRRAGPDLRPRELEVLALVATGLANIAIAEQLHISLNTVRNHVQSILNKLDAHSRLEAVAIGVRQGIIEPSI